MREISIENVPMFPVALLRYAPNITHLHLSSVSLDPARSFASSPRPPTPTTDLPLFLSLSTCRSDPIYVLKELLEEGGRFTHYSKRVNNLFLKPREGKLSDIRPYLVFMRKFNAAQTAGGRAPPLKHLTLALGEL